MTVVFNIGLWQLWQRNILARSFQHFFFFNYYSLFKSSFYTNILEAITGPYLNISSKSSTQIH